MRIYGRTPQISRHFGFCCITKCGSITWLILTTGDPPRSASRCCLVKEATHAWSRVNRLVRTLTVSQSVDHFLFLETAKSELSEHPKVNKFIVIYFVILLYLLSSMHRRCCFCDRKSNRLAKISVSNPKSPK